MHERSSRRGRDEQWLDLFRHRRASEEAWEEALAHATTDEDRFAAAEALDEVGHAPMRPTPADRLADDLRAAYGSRRRLAAPVAARLPARRGRGPAGRPAGRRTRTASRAGPGDDDPGPGDPEPASPGGRP
jgi:hypothetical protein